MNIPIITITGTKGKTTTSYLVAEVLQALGRDVLRVDTTGHYLNGKQRSTLSDSKQIWGLVPSVSPGRFLYEFITQPKLQAKGVAVLEASLGSSALPGMGYRSHDVGVFLNVFSDHLGSSSRLQSRADIADAKQFIFEKLERGGWAVANVDDELVAAKLDIVPSHLDIKILPCGLNFNHFDLAKHLASRQLALSVKDDKIVLLEKSKSTELVDLTKIAWTFNASYMPSVWNVLMAVAAVYALIDGKWTPKVRQAFEAVRLNPYGGRITVLKAANGATIISDYAHETVSLTEIAKLARTLVGPKGEVIGVVRLANDRTNELIRETGKGLAQAYDRCIVYDKIDGHFRKPRAAVRSLKFPESVGRVSEILAPAIAEHGGQVERILREDKALERAAEIAGPNDVVVHIVNDDVQRSIGFVKKYFKAEFV
ncbi:MAG TPA: Mur ligase family protein [Candidatus Limnocylindrales bacterium]|nr:Mur ligase family protein [Candidatus Limnocylindrales bacterium]